MDEESTWNYDLCAMEQCFTVLWIVANLTLNIGFNFHTKIKDLKLKSLAIFTLT